MNNMAVGALALYIASASTGMILSTRDNQVLVIHKEHLQVPAPSESWEMTENANMHFIFAKINSAQHEFTMARAYVCWMSSDMMEYLIGFGCGMNNMENTQDQMHIGRWLLW